MTADPEKVKPNPSAFIRPTHEIMERERFIPYVIGVATRENPGLADIGDDAVLKVVETALENMEKMEEVARAHRQAIVADMLPIPEEDAEKVTLLWPLTGAGLRRQPFGDDFYKQFPWAAYLGREILVHADYLGRILTENRGKKLRYRNMSGSKDAKRTEMRRKIEELGPYVLVNGTDAQNDDVRQGLAEGVTYMPPGKVHVMGAGITNTLGQIISVDLPPGLTFGEQNVVGVIAHPCNLERFRWFAAQHRDNMPFPQDVVFRAFPVTSPVGGTQQYNELNLRGILKGLVTGAAAQQPLPMIM